MKGESKMGLAAVFRVFPKSSLVTPQGDFMIEHVFKTNRAAKRAHYVYFFTHNGTAIFSRRINGKQAKFAIVSD
jgi:hypothetical protein